MADHPASYAQGWITLLATILGGLLSMLGSWFSVNRAHRLASLQRKEDREAADLDGRRQRLGHAYALVRAIPNHIAQVVEATVKGDRALANQLILLEGDPANNFAWTIRVDAPGAASELESFSDAFEACIARLDDLALLDEDERESVEEGMITQDFLDACMLASDALCVAVAREFDIIQGERSVAIPSPSKAPDRTLNRQPSADRTD